MLIILYYPELVQQFKKRPSYQVDGLMSPQDIKKLMRGMGKNKVIIRIIKK
jgi:hypothetical protein